MFPLLDDKIFKLALSYIVFLNETLEELERLYLYT